MKGLTFTVTILLFALPLLIFPYVFNQSLFDSDKQVIKNTIIDRVYYKFKSIEDGIKSILSKEANVGGVNITIENQGNFTIVNLTEVLPRFPSNSDFSQDLDKFLNFTMSKFNETNLIINLNFTELKCLPIIILPYNISIIHIPTDCEHVTAQTQVFIQPQNSWGYVNGYTFVFKPNGKLDTSSQKWIPAQCDNGGPVKLSVTINDTNKSFGPYLAATDYSQNCKFDVNFVNCPDGPGSVTVEHKSNDPKGQFIISTDPTGNCNMTSTYSLNLTTISGKTTATLPAQIIKVKETLYETEKNDTIYIYNS